MLVLGDCWPVGVPCMSSAFVCQTCWVGIYSSLMYLLNFGGIKPYCSNPMYLFPYIRRLEHVRFRTFLWCFHSSAKPCSSRICSETSQCNLIFIVKPGILYVAIYREAKKLVFFPEAGKMVFILQLGLIYFPLLNNLEIMCS